MQSRSYLGLGLKVYPFLKLALIVLEIAIAFDASRTASADKIEGARDGPPFALAEFSVCRSYQALDDDATNKASWAVQLLHDQPRCD